MEFVKRAQKEMQDVLDGLYKLDPFWKMCEPCANCGECCKESNPEFGENEIYLIMNEMNFTEAELNALEKNLKGKDCPFRLSDRCMIHEYRPLNCRWTPYQALIDKNHMIQYYSPVGNCKFAFLNKPLSDFGDDDWLVDEYYIKLPHFGDTWHYHIVLNALAFVQFGFKWDIPATEVAKLILEFKRNEE